MEHIHIPLKKFDLDGFIKKTIDFLKVQASNDLDPSGSIYWVESPGRGPHDEGEQGWDFKAKLMEGEVFLFFPFGSADLEGSFDCADGNSYRDSSGTAESAGDEDDESLFGDGIIGYLVRVENRSISIRFAICALAVCLPPPTVDLLPHGDFLEQPLVDFIKSFVRKDFDQWKITRYEKGNDEMANHNDVPELSAIMEEMIDQIIKERHLSRKDAEGACRLTLWTQGHFQRLKDAVLWNLDREKRWGKEINMRYDSADMDLLVKATGMNSESIFEEAFNMVDDFLFFSNQTHMKFMDIPSMDEFMRREVALVKLLKLEVETHFDSLARIVGAILRGYAKAQESIPRQRSAVES